MTIDPYFFSILSGILILFLYVYFLYLYKRKIKNEENWKKRLNQLLRPSSEERKEALPLIKKTPPTDFYFQSKLQKIEGMNEWLQQAGLKVSSTQFFLLCILSVSIIFAIFYLYIKLAAINSILFGIIITFIIAWGGLSYLRNRHKELFLREFPIALDIIRRALRAGFSTEKALEMVAEQQKGLIGQAFKTISDRLRLGETTEDVLADMSNRIGVNEFRLLAIVFVLQRETGGSLADSAENLSKVIRAREYLRQKVKSLTGEVRTTAAVLTCLPFFALGLIYLSSPKYLDPLFTTEEGNYLAIIGGILLLVGVTIIIRMSHKDLY
jgi:tight adherence protein B